MEINPIPAESTRSKCRKLHLVREDLIPCVAEVSYACCACGESVLMIFDSSMTSYGYHLERLL